MAERTRFSEMIEEVRSELGEPVESFFTNAEIARWLNYAVKLFARKTRCLKTKVAYAWPANTDSVSLSAVLPLVFIPNGSDQLNSGRTQYDPKIDNAEYNDGSAGYPIQRISKREVIDGEPSRSVESQKGPPSWLYYSPWENVLGLQPTPSTAGTLTMYYSYEPKKMDVNDAFNELLDSNMAKWWEDICAYAIYRGKLKDVDHFAPQEAQESLGRFTTAINMCRNELAIEDGPDVIDFIDDYLAPY